MKPEVATDPNPIDRHVGARLRQRRLGLGLSQLALGEAMGVTFQQVQKYEQGRNRVCASRLHGAAEALGCSIAWFFDELGGAPPPRRDGHLWRLTPEGVELAGLVETIPHPKVRRRLLALARTLAEHFTLPAAPCPPDG